MPNYEVYLAAQTADFILTQGPLGDLHFMKQTYYPYALGTVSDGFVVPPAYFFTNEVSRQIANELWVIDTPSLNRWLQFIDTLRKQNGSLKYVTNIYYSLLNKENWSIPMIEYSMSYSNMPIARLRKVGYREYINYHSISDSEFFNHVIQIILFGFVISNDFLRLMGKENTRKYISSRLIHGLIDTTTLRRTSSPKPSFFIPPDALESWQSIEGQLIPSKTTTIGDQIIDENIKNLYMARDNPFKVANIMADVSNIPKHHFFLGDNTEYMQALAVKNMITGISNDYIEYLRTGTVKNKMGYHLYNHVMKGIPMPKAPGDSII